MTEFDFTSLGAWSAADNGFLIPDDDGECPFSDEVSEWEIFVPLAEAFLEFALCLDPSDRSCFTGGEEGDTQYAEYVKMIPRYNKALVEYLNGLGGGIDVNDPSLSRFFANENA